MSLSKLFNDAFRRCRLPRENEMDKLRLVNQAEMIKLIILLVQLKLA